MLQYKAAILARKMPAFSLSVAKASNLAFGKENYVFRLLRQKKRDIFVSLFCCICIVVILESSEYTLKNRTAENRSAKLFNLAVTYQSTVGTKKYTRNNAVTTSVTTCKFQTGFSFLLIAYTIQLTP